MMTRTMQELAAMRAEIAALQGQVNTLVSYFAAMPTPPRARWERRSLPAWQYETLPLPARRSRKLEIVQPTIARVQICLSGNEQFVNAYDQHGEKIPSYCGNFRDVGLNVLERAGGLEWEVVAESA